MKRHWLAALGVSAIVSALASGTASADVGAGIGADPIMLPQALQPGHGYAMPPVYVVNTGSEPGRYGLIVQRLRDNGDSNVPTEWVRFDKNDFSLNAHESTTVGVTVSVPADAKAGAYASNVVVGTLPAGAVAGGTALGARAATDLKFQVSKPAPPIPWPWPWWSYAALGGALVLGAGEFLRRRYGLRIQIERRT